MALRQILDRHAAQIAEEIERFVTESRERERREFAELRAQERQEFTESLERAERELAEARERDRQKLDEAIAHVQIEFAGLRERDRQELAGAAAEERRQRAELREREQREFTASLAGARQEMAELRERSEQELAATSERERRAFADRLNQAVRRIRQSADGEEMAATLVDAAGVFCKGAWWVRVSDGKVSGGAVRGVPEDAGEAYRSLNLPLAEAPALAGAVESRDPMFAAVAEGELSAVLMQLPGHPGEGRVAIFPLLTRDGVPALLYTWGDGHEAALETLTQVAAAVWEMRAAKPAPAPTPELVRIAAVPVPSPTASSAPRSAWEQLGPEEQQIHLRAQRYARVQAAEMRLHEADAVDMGRSKRNLYTMLRKPIDQARKNFHERFFVPCPSMVDYLHLELVRTLANDDAELLGTDYPGPLV